MNFMMRVISLIKIEKMIGPKLDPRGTPDGTGFDGEVVFLSLTY